MAFLIGPNGFVIKPGVGFLQGAANDPCCCGACAECDALASSTPETISITIQNVTLCACLAGDNALPLFDPNGTFTLTRGTALGSECIWRRETNEASNIIESYNGASCTGTVFDSTDHLDMQLVLSGGVWSFYLFGYMGMSVSGQPYWFHASASATDCTTPFTLTNAASGCDNNDGAGAVADMIIVATGGTVDCTPL